MATKQPPDQAAVEWRPLVQDRPEVTAPEATEILDMVNGMNIAFLDLQELVVRPIRQHGTLH
jgi:hypothetical protein